MPYVSKEDRMYEEYLENVVNSHINCSGDLNFAITTILGAYVLKKGLRYQNIHDAVNTLYDAAAEFKRRIEFPYEDIAIRKNGDVSTIIELEKQINEMRGDDEQNY